MSPRRLRASLLALLSLLVLAATLPSAASAARVTSPQPWKAANTYLVRVNLDGRAAPKLQPVAKVDHLKAGQWVRISCQIRGESAYGSTLWAKVNGLYVPDHYLKTYTDGVIRGVPRCQLPPVQGPKPPTRADYKRYARQVAMERVRGPLYARYKRSFPTQLNWDNDGCSIPKLPGWTKVLAPGLGVGTDGLRAGLRRFFQASCDRHDFGYRNYGPKRGGLQVRPTRAGKRAIDRRFRSNMYYQCEHEMVFGLRTKCKEIATIMYIAVDKKGDSAFFSR